MTPHINCKKEDIAKIVLMPGDPLRAKYIAESFLENYKTVNNIRNMLFFTGTYKNKEKNKEVRVTIAGSGMGCPSIGIYSYELFKFYDVETIIRIGSAGAYTENLELYDLFNATAAYSESSFAKVLMQEDNDILQPSDEIFKKINETAQQLQLKLHNGIVHSSDVFYRKNFNDYKKIYKEKNAQVVEMESFALFANAKLLNKKAACILSISDSLVKKQEISAEQRETAFSNMMKLALETAINL